MMTRTVLPLSSALFLVACNGEDVSFNPESGGTGEIDIFVTGSPVDFANRVVLNFTGVTLLPEDDEPIFLTVNPPQALDILEFQGSDWAQLIENARVPAGTYEGLRLRIVAEEQTLDSFVDLSDGGQESIYIPRGEELGLAVPVEFTVPAGADTEFVIDFDLRRGLVAPLGSTDYELRPFVRFQDAAEVGTLSGTVPYGLLTGAGCPVSPSPTYGRAVFAFEGEDAEPDDFDGTGDAFSSGTIRLDPNTGRYTYFINVLPGGFYTIAFTCRAIDDLPGRDDVIDFTRGGIIEIVPGRTAEVNFADTTADPSDDNGDGFFVESD